MVIQDAFGSPDVRQIDGLGGADILTSKVAIVSKRDNNTKTGTSKDNNETQEDGIVADIDYLFGQVEFGKTSSSGESGTNTYSVPTSGVLYDVNCGNISAGVGPFAIEEGLMEVTDDTVTPIEMPTNSDGDSQGQKFCQKVRIHNVNTGKIIVAEAPVQKIFTNDHQDDATTKSSYWEVVEDGDYEIDGVPGTSACIPIDFSKCTGTLGESNHGNENEVVNKRQELLSILPSGNPKDTVIVDECAYDVSLLDVANFVVHIDGRQLGLTGKEDSKEILNDVEFWNTVRKIRYEAAKLVLEEDEITLTRPFTSVVFPYLCDEGYESIRGDVISDEEGTNQEDHASIDFRAFVLFCDHPHKAYPGTASNATAAAALIEGTVVNDVMNRPIETTVGNGNTRCKEKVVTIGHPSGRMSVSSRIEERSSGVDDTDPISDLKLLRSVIGRTSRRLADGRLYLKAHIVRRLNSER